MARLFAAAKPRLEDETSSSTSGNSERTSSAVPSPDALSTTQTRAPRVGGQARSDDEACSEQLGCSVGDDHDVERRVGHVRECSATIRASPHPVSKSRPWSCELESAVSSRNGRNRHAEDPQVVGDGEVLDVVALDCHTLLER